MPQVINAHVDSHLTQSVGAGNYTVVAATATLPSVNMSQAKLITLIDVALAAGQKITVVSGVITIQPR